MAEHVFDASVYHHAWDRDLEPALTIQPGDTVHFDLLMAGDRQVQEGATFEQCEFDFDTLYNLAGPIRVEGAQPGDTLSVEILSLEAGEWGWCAILPEFGLLPEEFPDGFVRTFDLRGGSTTTLVPGVEIPIVPFCGTIGNCPDREGTFIPFPPHEGGGNVDTRHLTAGTTFHIPVHLPGAHFSIGDPHAAQGDGEVCVAAIECPMRASLRFDVAASPLPRPLVHDAARLAHAARGRRRLLRHDGHRRGPHGGRADRRAQHDRAAGRAPRARAARRLHALQPRRRPQDPRDRRRRRVERRHAACRAPCSSRSSNRISAALILREL